MQKSSKLSIAEGTLHSLPNDTSVGDKNSMYESLNYVGTDRTAVVLSSSENVLKESASADVVIQRSGSDKQVKSSVSSGLLHCFWQSALGCDKRSTTTRKSNSRSGSREPNSGRNKDKNRNCLMGEKEEEEEEPLTIESPDSMAIKRRIQVSSQISFLQKLLAAWIDSST